MDAQEMDALRTARCTDWLDRIGRWAGHPSNYPAALGCEVVRGIVAVDDPEYVAGVAWAGRELTAVDWLRALELYGPAGQTRDGMLARSVWLESAAKLRDRVATQTAVR